MSETEVKKAMVAAASRLIVLLNSSKFGVLSLATVVRAEDIDVLVTDDQAPPETLRALVARGVDVRVVSVGSTPAGRRGSARAGPRRTCITPLGGTSAADPGASDLIGTINNVSDYPMQRR